MAGDLHLCAGCFLPMRLTPNIGYLKHQYLDIEGTVNNAGGLEWCDERRGPGLGNGKRRAL